MDTNHGLLIIGIGASAGGLKPLQQLFEKVSPDVPAAYFVIQHLDPTHKSLLSELLAKKTKLKVSDAKNNGVIRSGNVYVIPPGKYLEISKGNIKLINKNNGQGARMAIDHFFRSLAHNCGEKCVGIVLSGAGSDGTAGLREIKAVGGLTLAQKPDSAEHPSMPNTAIEADAIDKIANVEDIAGIIQNYLDHPLTFQKEKQSTLSNGTLEKVTNILANYEKFELSQYKPNTVYRRITRRMSLTGFTEYEAYIDELQKNSEERKLLSDDLLINVTDFFRDPKAFQILEEEVVPEILKSVDKEEDIRIWIAGCASGEEAYSIAIVFLEAIRKKKTTHGLKIFATDIDESAISTARQGIYPVSIIKEIPEEYLKKYFTQKESGSYQIKSSVRDLISFAIQNVATHPPFSHMHLISCRNLLIYMKKKIQEKILNAFYFALEKDSFLFLGSSETISNKTDFFRSVSKKWRLYRKIPGRDKDTLLLQHLHIEKNSTPALNTPFVRSFKAKDQLNSRADQIRKALLDAQLPPTVIIDENGDILYYHGDLKPYMNFPVGEPRNNIMQLVLPELRSRLRSCLYKIRKTSENQTFHCAVSTNVESETQTDVRISIYLLHDQKFTEGEALSITFTTNTSSTYVQNDSVHLSEEEKKVNYSLELELAETKDELQSTIEELESSTEELKASHEEALSTNEELQSANEELEASSEELRSLNEELSTVNGQLKEKIELLQQANNDVENFFASTDIPTIFLNVSLEIQRYTPAAEQLLLMGPQDMGRYIHSLGRNLVDDNLVEECQQVLKNFQPIQKEKQDSDGKWFIRSITPYRTEDLKIEGVVVTFQDVTEIKLLSKRAEAREHQQLVVAKLGMLALQGADPDELMHQAIREVAQVLDADYSKILKYQPEQKNLLLIAGTGWKDGCVGEVTVPDDYNSQAGYTLLSKEPVIVKDLTKEKRFQGPQLLLDHHVVSGISCLINHTTPPFGVIAVHTTKYREYTQDDANFLQSVANMVSTALKTREGQEKLYASEEQFRIIANAIPQLAWIADNTGYIYWYNQRWYDYTGTTLEDVEGWKWKSVHSQDAVSRVVDKYKSHIKAVKEWEDTFQLLGADGTYRWFLSRAMPVKDKKGEVVSWLGTNTDISEHLELEDSLRQVIRQLETTDQRKNEFLAVLGHELRNPLASLRAGVELLDVDMYPPRNIIEIMTRSTSSIARLLDDLLDLSRIARKKIDLKLTVINVNKHLHNCITNVKHELGQKKQSLTTNIAKELYIDGDAIRLEQIFLNILVNAIKYTHQGGNISVEAWEEDAFVNIKIEDDGIGISPDQQESIFDDFYQIQQKGKAASGLGIGLALVKQLMNMQKGTVQVFSEGLNKGSYFLLSFPAREKPVEKPSKSTMNIHLAEENEKDVSIVLIEDNKDVSDTMSMVLEHLNCEVFTADNGSDGITLIKEKVPDLAFVDIGLPDITGYDIAVQLRADRYEGKLMALSGYSHQAARKRSMESGFNEHIAKPVGKEQLVDVFKKYIW